MDIIKTRLSTILVIVVFFPSIIGLTQKQIDAIINTYVDKSAMLEKYKMIQRAGIETGLLNPCTYNKESIAELGFIGPDNVNIENEIKYGDFNDQNGYRLIVDTLNTIDIPAIIKCIPKLKNNGQFILYGGKALVYYLIYYDIEDRVAYERVHDTDTIDTVRNKTVLILSHLKSINEYIQTYNKNKDAAAIKKWFKNIRNRNREIHYCNALSSFGRMKDKTAIGWTILGAKVVIGNFNVLLSSDMQCEIRAFFKCRVYVKKGSDTAPTYSTEFRYFTVSKLNIIDENRTIYGYLYGPRTIKEKETFAIYEGLLPNE